MAYTTRSCFESAFVCFSYYFVSTVLDFDSVETDCRGGVEEVVQSSAVASVSGH